MTRMLRYTRWAVLPLALLLPLGAQNKKEAKDAKATKDQGITREQADEILTELRQIRQLLEKQGSGEKGGPPAPTRAKLNLEGFQMLGSKDAPITIVEFTDYQCPFCRQFHTTTYADLKKNYIDTGKVRFYSRDLPLDSIHPDAFRAAQAARCAGDQGQYWKMRDAMGANPGKLDLESLIADATELKMNPDVFRVCVQSQKYKEAIQTDVLEAMKIGAEATPTFVVGKSTPQGVDGELLVGAQPYVEFLKAFSRVEGAK
jgi:protein-disulfide isomerase